MKSFLILLKIFYLKRTTYFDLGQGKDYVYHGTTIFKGIHKNDILTLAEKQMELYKKNSVHEIFPEYWANGTKLRNKGISSRSIQCCELVN